MNVNKIVPILLSTVLALLLMGGIGLRVADSAQAALSIESSVPFPATIAYPGRLTDDAGQPIGDGLYDFNFALYAAATGGEPLWSEAHTRIAVTGGAFIAVLGSESSIPSAELQQRDSWLSVEVRGPGASDFTALTPRQRLHAAASAVPDSQAAASTCAHDHVGETWSASIPWSNGVFKVSNSSNGPSIWGTNSGGGNAVRGDGYGTSIGVYGEGADGPGVAGRSAKGHGVEGFTDNGEAAVFGSGGNAVGVWGHSDQLAGVFAHSTNGVGISVTADNGDIIRAFGASGSPDIEFSVTNTGEVYADGSFHPNGADFAEMLPAAPGLEAGDVLVIGADGELVLAQKAFDRAVAGVYSTQPGFVGGAGDGVDLTGQIPLAIVGIAPVKVSAENGPIHPGDLLASATTPGHAMAAGENPPQGTVVGKALEPLEVGAGVIRVLITLQ